MIFLPYRDDNPIKNLALVNWCLILGNLWVFLFHQLPLSGEEESSYFSSFGFTPYAFFQQFAPFCIDEASWQWATILTSMFSHGGLLHLLGNMLFLYLYGDNLEDAMGKINYLFYFLFCGLFAALAQACVAPDSRIPMVGASGAISGVIAGYLLLFPRANVRVFYWFFIFVGTLYLPAYLILGIWVFEQIIALPEAMSQVGGVAIAAHLGGFAAGIILTPFFKRKEVRFFQKPRSRAFARKSARRLL